MAIKYDFEQSVGYWVGASSHLIEQALSAELAPVGITLRQVQVLACLVLFGEMMQAELAQRMGIEPSTVVRVLDRMERDGWLERRPDPTDRRRKLIRPTRKVAPHWKTIVATGKEVERRATQGLSQKQLDELQRTLGVIRKNLAGDA